MPLTHVTMSEERFVRAAIDLARQARANGDAPFGALLVVDGAIALTAVNTIERDRDPTAHAETNLVAAAIRSLPSDALARAVLYTSCEPCAMCSGKIYWAGIRSVVYALSHEQLAAMAGPDFLVPCRELFARGRDGVDVRGPLLPDEAAAVHEGFWPDASH
jgi:tRNA(Arg) A34 adenosine deaminase TadA